MEALVTFLNPHNRAGVSCTEGIPPQWVHLMALQSKKKKQKRNLTCLQNTQQSNLSCNGDIMFLAKISRSSLRRVELQMGEIVILGKLSL